MVGGGTAVHPCHHRSPQPLRESFPPIVLAPINDDREPEDHNSRRIPEIPDIVQSIMSAPAAGSVSTSKAVVSDKPSSDASKDQQKPAAALEEDDEFEDFPVEGELTTRPSEVADSFVEAMRVD